MSQQAQAEGLQQQAVQALEELHRQASDNYRKLSAGEMSQEAYDSAAKEIDAKIEATDALVERASKLNTIKSRHVSLGDKLRKPDIARPLTSSTNSGDLGDDQQREQLSSFIDRFIERTEQIRDVSDGLPLMRQGSRERALLNRYLRPQREGLPGWQIRAKLSKEDMDFLTRPRSEKLMNAYVDRDGGYVTAEEMRNEMISLREKEVGIVSRARNIQTNAARISFPTAQIVFSMGKRGRTGHDPINTLRLTDVFGKTSFMPAGRDVILKAPQELVEDAFFDLVGFLAEEAGRVSREEDEQLFLSGSGSGEPLGYLTAMVKLYDAGGTGVGIDPDGNDVPAFTEGDFNSELIQVFDTYMIANARSNAVWIGPRVFERKVRLFRDDSGASAGTGDYLFKRALEAGAPNTLNGYPLLVSEFFPDAISSGNAGDPMFSFGDLSDYWWVSKQGLRLRVLDQLYAETNEIGYKYDKAQDGALVRADGNIYARRQSA